MAKQRSDNRYASSPDNRFPYVMTTYRLTEHHTSGAMSRTLSHLAELQPDPFCEISAELAAERGINNGDWVTITSMRGIIEVRALVTSRMQPLDIDGRRVQQVGVPFHWGYRGLVTGRCSQRPYCNFGRAECTDIREKGAAVQRCCRPSCTGQAGSGRLGRTDAGRRAGRLRAIGREEEREMS